MKSINELYGDKIKKREFNKLEIEISYREALIFLINEEIDEWIDICSKIRTGECDYRLNQAIINLGKLTNKRDQLLEEVNELKGVDEMDDFI